MPDAVDLVDLDAYLATPSPVELELTKLFQHYERLTIFDVGACEGEDSIRYGRRFPNASLYAFEPLPENQRLAKANIERYSACNVELIGTALSDRSGETVLHVSSGRPEDLFAGEDWNYGNKSSSLLQPASPEPMYGWITFCETALVATDTLDSFCERRGIRKIDFLHMDVQGAEHLVLVGASRMLSRTTAIWLEVTERALYQGQHTRAEIKAFLTKHGFRLALEVMLDIEGDQLYVNVHHMRVWPYLVDVWAARYYRNARHALGRWRRRFVHAADS